MQTKFRIVYTRPDGGVSVVTPTGDISIEAVMAKDVPAGATNVRRITTAELPPDRVFRNAWDDSNLEDFIGLNLGKAKEIAHDMRRAGREELLVPLDKEHGYASTNSARKTAIDVERNDILSSNAAKQIAIDSANDEEALRAVL